MATAAIRSFFRCFPLIVALLALPVAAETKLLRFPDLHGDRVVFTYAGDLWLAPAGGGRATRLTAHPGVELFAKFSPDGSQIAFTGQYDGDEQVYLIPAEGGEPTQLTFYPANGPLPDRWGYDNQVYDFTPDGASVLFRSMRYGFELSDTRLFTVPVEGGLPTPLPMPVSGAGDLSPDGKSAVYTPLARDFRTWKRYEGGWAQDLWVYDLATNDVRRVTDHPRTDRDPMWIGDRIYFASDRDGTLNLYAWNPATGATEQLTHSDVWDVRWPSDDGTGRIVYEQNGELAIYDIAAKRSTPIRIDVPDDGLWKRPERISAARNIEDFALSPKGERALVVARGDLFTVPAEKGPTRNLTRSSGAHDKWARWSPDGTRIAFISDASGEEEVWIVAQDGAKPAERLTTAGAAMRYAPEWSPDGARLALSDKDGKLYVVEVVSGKISEVADDVNGEIRDYVWAPDGAHLAFSMGEPNGFSSIWIWSAGESAPRRVTGELANEFSPAWDPKGDYLYYLSDREYAPQISGLEWNFAANRTASIYALALRRDVPHPFPPESDEVSSGDDAKPDGEARAKVKSKDKDEKEAVKEQRKPVRIDFEGLGGRVARLPLDPGNYGGLTAIEGHLLYSSSGPFYYGRESDTRPSLRIFSIEKRKEGTIAEGVRGWAVSGDGKKVLVRGEGGFRLLDAQLDVKKESAKELSTAGLLVDRVPVEEWRQIFDEVWRRYRDFFYVENMHGYDWKAIGERFRALLDHVAHRSDLNYVLGEMVAELNVGHAYVSGGDLDQPERPSVALPGADFALDREAGRYRLAKIFRGHNEEPRYRSPLTEIGVDVREGDYLLEIDGEPVGPRDNPYARLRNRADRPVELTVNDRPVLEGARRATFLPITDEDPLRYLDWVESSRRRVDALSGGRVGYLHIPDMGADGLREFIKWYYPQIRKDGLVVDVRNNGGGNVSRMLIERLDNKLLGTRFSRTVDTPRTYPEWVLNGPMACVLDEDSASDGDIFPHMFRKAGLGPLIGKRSWGGVVGITSHGPLIDGGDVRVPEFGTNDVDGSWIIEGHGVDPDIVVENDPKSVVAGRDPQLERAVAEVLRRIETEGRPLPARPAPPVKTR